MSLLITMQPVVVALLLAIAVAPALAVSNSSSAIIKKTCAALQNQPRGYCVSVFSNDTEAAAATDVRALAVAAINITARKAASTLSAISYLLDDLSICRWCYHDMVGSLAGVLDDFRAGRFDHAANAMAENVSIVPNGCCDIQLFQGLAKKNPFEQENTDNDEIANLASDITELVAMNT